ncbi:MAG TPA: AAA family ATPase, partial [Spirochaetota bacterium]|nr:AAA family ATPase [Spirochaetota bacterium]
MSEHLIQKNYNFIKKLPEWAKIFAIKYCSNTASTFIFHGNIRDFLPQRTEDENFKFVKIQDYFADVLFGYKGKILCYDRSSGITFIESPYNKEDTTKNDFINTMLSGTANANKSEKIKKMFSRNLTNSFEMLEKYFYKKIEQKERVVLIIDFAETIVPTSSSTSFSEEDRFSLVTLKRWSYNPLFIQKDISIIL